MNNLLPQFDRYKDKIPEFIIKLYHILEQPEYNDYLIWHGDQILIKNPKKLQEKVLPNFFRHKHISSFIRQLNMYKFSKVNKMIKEKGCMYFRNDHFKRGQIKQLAKITRNQKKSRGSIAPEESESESPQRSENISINKALQDNSLKDYKAYVKNSITELMKVLKDIEQAHPETKNDLIQPLAKCNEILEIPSQNNLTYSFFNFDQALQNKNMLSTMKLLPPIEPMLFSSQCSFMQIN